MGSLYAGPARKKAAHRNAIQIFGQPLCADSIWHQIRCCDIEMQLRRGRGPFKGTLMGVCLEGQKTRIFAFLHFIFFNHSNRKKIFSCEISGFFLNISSYIFCMSSYPSSNQNISRIFSVIKFSFSE
jgi:hypothetical protein